MNSFFRILALVVLVIAVFVQTAGFAKTNEEVKVPKNIILLISDGWGYNQIEATNCYQYGLSKGVQVYEQFPVVLGMSTYSADNDGYAPYEAWADFDYVATKYTDSAASATAISTGVKTYNGSINMDMEQNPLITVVERAEEMGKATGVVTSVPFNHATPTGMVAHNESRNNYQELAREMIYRSDLDVIMGAGHPWYDNDNIRQDAPYYRYIDETTFSELVAGTAGNDADNDGEIENWTFIDDPAEFQNLISGQTPERVFGLAKVYSTLQQSRQDTSDSELPYANTLNDSVPTLKDMTAAALNVLDNNSNGFFVMIEGGAVDWAGHANQTDRLIEEQIDFNESVRAAVTWVNQYSNWDETLIIVTGDHETGYFTGPGSGIDGAAIWNDIVNNGKGNLPGAEWHSGDHTNQLIPLYARGAGSNLFELYADEFDPVRGSFMKNSEIGQGMLTLWPKQEIVPPKNIVLLISDGWGYNHVLATNYYEAGRDGIQSFQDFPVQYPMSTYSSDNDGYKDKTAVRDPEYIRQYDLPAYSKATDSAASATAISTGVKTYNGAINVDPYQNPLESVVEKAEKLGKATGTVTSVPFNHATPAGMVAHNVTRNDYKGIADEMIFVSGLDLVMGAGHPWYNDDNQLLDTPYFKYMTEGTYTKLSADMAENDADNDGYNDKWTFIDDPADFVKLSKGATPKRVFGLAKVYSTLQQGRDASSVTYGGWNQDDPQDVTSLPYTDALNADVPSLAEMTEAALNILDNDKDGFFVMIEGGAVDWAAHCNSTPRMIEEQQDFNKAVDATVRWVNENSNWNETLVIVTGDHECGYLTGPHPDGLEQTTSIDPVVTPIVNNGAGKLPGTAWYSRYHTNALIPLYAKGQGADLFDLYADEQDTLLGAFVDNAEIGQVIHQLYDNATPGYYIVPSDVFRIISVKDVPNDQGRQVRIMWNRHAEDAEGAITKYSIYRKIDPALSKLASASENTAGIAGYWDFVKEVPAVQGQTYATTVATLKDSTINDGMYESTFYVMAHTNDPATHYETLPMSGYSIDNLRPANVRGLQVQLINNTGYLSWEESTIEDLGSYKVYRSMTPDFTIDAANCIAEVAGNQYVDKNIRVNADYYYAVTAVDFSGNESEIPARTATTTDVNGKENAIPVNFVLAQNYPNPFNPNTTIEYAMPEYGHVKLSVYNILGEEVAVLVNSVQPAGYYKINWDASNMSSGLYLYKFESGSTKMFKKMQLLK